jgi:hypothetical protein
VKTLAKAVLLLAAACGLCFVLSRSASADVVEPKSAYQPASVGLLEGKAAKAAMPASQEAVPEQPDATPVEEAQLGETVEPTPAPEQMVRPAAPSPVMHSSSSQDASSPVQRLLHPLGTALQRFQASLGRAVSACEVGFGSTTGGPVIVFAVLAMALPFIRRRVVGTRWAADEDMPEFLFARELTPPG